MEDIYVLIGISDLKRKDKWISQEEEDHQEDIIHVLPQEDILEDIQEVLHQGLNSFKYL